MPGSYTPVVNVLSTVLWIFERDNRRRSQKNRATILCGGEQSRDQSQSQRGFQKPDAAIESCRQSHDQSKGLTTSCATNCDFQGPVLGHKYVCWLVSGWCPLGCSHAAISMSSCHTVHFIICIEKLRRRPSGFLGRGQGRLFSLTLTLSLSLSLSPVL